MRPTVLLALLLAACAGPDDDKPAETDGPTDDPVSTDEPVETDETDPPEETGDTAPPNGPPVATSVTLTPTDATTVDAVVATPVGTDPEGDPITWTFRWTVAGVDVPGVTGDTLPAEMHARDQAVVAYATPSDPAQAGAALGSAPLVIANTPPEAADAVIAPAVPTVLDAVTCAATLSDVDGDAVTPTYAFDVAGTVVQSGPSDTLGGGFVRGERVTCSVTPDDGTDTGAAAVAFVVVGNADPSLTTPSITPPAPRTDDTLTAAATASDPDGDAPTLTWVWTVAGVEVQRGPDATLDGSVSFDAGQAVVVEAIADDGFGGTASAVSAPVIVANTPPVVADVALTPADPTVEDALTCSATASDADGDAVSLTYAFDVGGVVVQSGVDDTLGGGFARGDMVTCTVTPSDGTDTGAPWAASVGVVNADPSVTVPTITPPDPRTADTLTAAATASDPDGDGPTLSWAWFVDGFEVQRGATDTLDPTLFEKDQSVEVEVTADDGFGGTATARSVPVVVGNTPPVAADVVLSPSEPTVLDAITCVATLSDADDDAVTATYAFAVEGTPVQSGGDPVLSSGFAKGDTVTCQVTPSDGTEDGAAVTGSTLVVNAPPGAPDVFLDPLAPGPGDDLVCTVETPASDPDGDPLTYTATWTRDGADPAGVATTTTWPGDTIPAAETVAGETWACTLVADDGEDTGPPGAASVTVERDAVTRIAGTGDFLCAWSPGDAAVCWGENLFDNEDPLPPDVQDMWVGDTSGCAIDTAGALTCFAKLEDGIEAEPGGAFQRAWPMNTTACGWRVDGTVTCWGASTPVSSTPSTVFTEVDLTTEYGCGVRADTGGLSCWGDDVRGRTSPPAGTGWVQVEAGRTHACARKDTGQVSCWGEPPQGPFTVPGGSYVDLDVSADSSCGVRDPGGLTCWGYMAADVPIPTGAALDQLEIASGRGCGRRPDGRLVCWGSDYHDAASPPAGSYVEITTPGDASCALAADGSVRCWGNPSGGVTVPPTAGNILLTSTNNGTRFGWLDADGEIVHMGTWFESTVPMPTGPFVDLATGDAFGCGIRAADGSLACFGSDDAGQATPPPGSFVDVAADSRSACGIRDDGAILCWGADFDGALVPPTGTDWQRLTMSQRSGCAVDGAGLVTCFGDGAATFEPPPTFPVVEIEGGQQVACATDALGALHCWGNRGAHVHTPLGGTGWQAVTVGNFRACALDPFDQVSCWGSGSPFASGGEPSIPLVQIAASSTGACGLAADGSLACWGDRWRRGALP